MKDFIILSTTFQKGYWRKKRRAPFTNLFDSELSNLENNYTRLNAISPINGIGFYKNSLDKTKCSENELIDFINITSIEKIGDKDFYINFKPVGQSNIPSIDFENSLPPGYRYIFNIIELDKVREVVLNLGGIFPDNKTKGIETDIEIKESKKEEIITKKTLWEQYIGEYFLTLKNPDFQNDNDFEDKVFDLLKAIGFDVKQKGYKKKGSYPDGTAIIDKYTLVYDCKNSNNYYPNIEDINKMKSYVDSEKSDDTKMDVYPLFIARNYSDKINKSYGQYFNIETMLYLFYVKIRLGNKFNLNKVKKIFKDNLKFDKNWIDNEYL